MKRRRSSIKIPEQIVSTDLYLDDDCWEYIFKFIFDQDQDENRYYFKSLSIVSKQFLSITNRMRLSLTVWNPTCRLLSRLFPRFINLISLDLSCYYGNINNLLVQISRYPLKLTSLNLSNQPNIPARGLRAFSRNIRTITSLTCSNIASLSVADLLLISHCFPFLQELDLSNSINSRLNADMSGVFPKLRKVNLYCSINKYITDEWLLYFFKNSEFLEDVVMTNGSLLTHHGIASAIRLRPTLKSLTINWMSGNFNITSHLIDSLLSLKDLTCLDLSYLIFSDELLSSIAMIGLPLKKLVLHACRGYSYAGIFSLLSKCQYIQHLDLPYSDFLSDQHVMKLSSFFGHLVSINLSCCSMLAEPALFSLVRNSPLLTEVKMEYTRIGREHVINSNSFEDFVVSHSLKSLHLANSYWLRDESIKMFASTFPNLEVLSLRCCNKISEKGIYQVLTKCCKIRDLNLHGCSGVKLHEMNFEVPKLKALNLSCTSVDDETLYVISKSCSGLLQLVLRSCNHVTKEGIKHVLKNCTQLREINLMCCYKLLPNIVDEMILLRPSLRKITASPSTTFSDKKFSDEKRKHFSRYGCLLMC